MGDDEGTVRADARVDYISSRVQATFPKMVVSALLQITVSRLLDEKYTQESLRKQNACSTDLLLSSGANGS